MESKGSFYHHHHRLQQVVDYQPGDCQWSSEKNSEAPHIKKDSSPLSVLMMFFTENFYLLVEQANLYYQQHLDSKPDLATDCLTLHLHESVLG
jgi:hypothetical protein